MAIYTGNQLQKPVVKINEELKALRGELDEKTARITLAKFLRYNLGFTSQLMLGINMEPIQEIHMNALFLKNNSMFVWSRGAGKSTVAGWYAIMKCIFEPGTRVVIASANFRTSRRIFEEIVKLLSTEDAQLARQCFHGQPKLRNDKFQWDINGGYICAIPLSEDTRGMRCDVLILDELMLLSPMMINDVLSPFLSSPRDAAYRIKIRKLEDSLIKSGVLHPNNRILFENPAQMIGLSSASYQFQHLYKMFVDWGDFIERPELVAMEGKEQEPPTYFLSQLGWEAIPPTILNRNFIKGQEASVSADSFGREYCAQFRDGGDGYFSMRKMNSCTIPDGELPHAKVLGDPLKKYILSIDPNYSKCFGKGTRVLMYDGSTKSIEDIVIGDIVMGDDNLPRVVTKIFSGQDEMFKVSLVGGDSHVVNKNHILCLEQSNNPERGFCGGTKVEISVGDYIQQSKEWRLKHAGYKVGVEWDEKPLPIDPYFIGIWLGDGSRQSVSITTMDQEIKDYIYKFAEKHSYDVTIRSRVGNKASTYNLVRGKGTNVKKILDDLGILNKKSIPLAYLANSRENRLKLLAGLIDTGGCRASNNGISFCNTNWDIIDGYMFLCKSLGFRTYLRYYPSKNIKHKSHWTVTIFGENLSEIPVLLKRKTGVSSKTRKSLRYKIKNVESIGVDNYYGISLGDNERFLLGDFTVTHNSPSADYFAMSVIEIDDEKEDGILVHAYQKVGADLQDNIKYLYYLMSSFNVALIVADSAAIDTFLDACNDNELFKNNLKKKITYITEWDSTKDGQEYVDMLQESVKQYNVDLGCMCIRQTFSTDFLIRSNSYLQSCIDHKKIWFASRASSHPNYIQYMFNIKLPLELIFPKGAKIMQADSKEETRKLSVREHVEMQDDIILDTKEQCANIEVSTTTRGTQSFDLPRAARNATSNNKPRKDNYTTLLLANWGVKCYFDLKKNPLKVRKFDFTPSII